ncbi:MAG: formylmethanofuran dehydrogenase subunit A [Methanotrichaceae archaeon]
MIIKGGIVYDPANEIFGEEMDICIENGKVVEDTNSTEEIDARSLLVMPGGVDGHAHIAGKVNTGRIMRPEDSRLNIEPRTKLLRPSTGYTVPNCYATGYRYARMGYTMAFEAATPILESRHTHEELEEIPIVDKGALTLFGDNWETFDCVREDDMEKLAAYIAWGLKASRGYGVKVVNPGGGEAWGFGSNVKSLDDPVPEFEITPREIIRSLVAANEMLKLPHSVHIHTNNLGKPGNYTTALETLDAVKDIAPSRDRQILHVTHMQFSAYGGTGWRDFKSEAPEIADYFNKHDQFTMDMGQLIFGSATTMTADAPLEYNNAKLLHTAQWANHDVELEGSSGVVPLLYLRKSPVNAVQWAIGLELALLTKSPWKVMLTTDHPNGGPFVNYPEVETLLMSQPKREAEIATLHAWVSSRSALASIDRELDWGEIATMTRAAPARILGLNEKGHLGPGADADVTIYDLKPNEIDPSKDHERVREALSRAKYTIKDGKVVVRNGEVVAVPSGRTYWVDAAIPQNHAERLQADLAEKFAKYYSIEQSNYMVQDAYVTNPVVVKAEGF